MQISDSELKTNGVEANQNPGSVPTWNDSLLAELVYRNPQQLTRLVLSYALLISDTGILNVAKNMTSLKSLDLRATNISDISISALAKRCRFLNDVDISHCRFLTDNALIALIDNCRQLTRLIINDCSNFTDLSLMNLCHLNSLAHLEMNHISRATDDSLLYIIRFCELKYLSARGCPLIGDQSIGKLSSLNRKWPGIRHLLIGNSDITDEALIRIALTCHELRTLDVSNCGVISDVSVLEIAHGLPKLRAISIQGCSRVSDAAFIVLVRQLQYLRTFNAGNCDNLSDCTLLELANHSHQLRHVNIQGCIRVTDRGIYAVLSKCQNLKTLILCGCALITDQAVILPPDAQSLACLTLLDLRMCHLVTYSAIRYLRRHFPKMVIVDV